MKRGALRCDPTPITADEVLGWFANCRGKTPSFETCAEIAGRLDGPPSESWLAYSHEQEGASRKLDNGFDHWDFTEVSAGLNLLVKALPAIIKHWNDVIDCEDSLLARSALAELNTALGKSSHFVEYPFGEYSKSYRHIPKSWHLPAIFVLRIMRDAFGTVRFGSVSFSSNSQAVKVTKVVLERMGYGAIEQATIAAHAKRWFERYGDPMTTKEGPLGLLPV